MREQVAQTIGALEELHLGSQATGLGGNCYKSSARVSNEHKERHVRCAKQESSVEKIRCRVKRVGALRYLGIRHVMERL